MIVTNENTMKNCPSVGRGKDSKNDVFSSTFTAGFFATDFAPYSAASGSLNGFFAALAPPNGLFAAPGAAANGDRASAAPNGLAAAFARVVVASPLAAPPSVTGVATAPNGLAGLPVPSLVAFSNGDADVPGAFSNGDVAPVFASNGDRALGDAASPNVDGSGFGFHFFDARAAAASSASASASASARVVPSPVARLAIARRRTARVRVAPRARAGVARRADADAVARAVVDIVARRRVRASSSSSARLPSMCTLFAHT